MKTNLIILSLLLSAGSAGAQGTNDFTVSISCFPGKPENRDYLHVSTWNMGYQVIRGSTSYTLDEFVKSGEFCKANGGHRWVRLENWYWTDDWEKKYGHMFRCIRCDQFRKKVPVTKTEMEWEP